MRESRRDVAAMGSDCSLRVIVDDDRAGPLLDRAVELIERLEQKWSRFRPDSELCQLNAHAGAPVFTSTETVEVLALALEAWRATDGLFDPSLLDALLDAGYDVTFDELRGRLPADAGSSTPIGRPPLELVDVDRGARLVHCPPGLHLDLGGIGKGRAADLVAEQLLADGVEGACVDLGGDLRVVGTDAEGEAWTIVVDDPFRPGDDLVVLGMAAGAVTTPSILRRRWVTDTGEAHHLLDPGTGRPVRSGLVSVTVLAASAAWGEVHAKAALVAGADEGHRLVERAGLSALFVDAEGRTESVGSFDAFVLG
jgi:thiamine biosynthesis lipoprotein